QRIIEIEAELLEIEHRHATPGEETIPARDSSWQSWRYGKASNWATLYQAGGFSAQPLWWLRDMQWFDTWDYYYSLIHELETLQALLAKGNN
ncbi:unnamed protein product, partial [marine sediment metagenome]